MSTKRINEVEAEAVYKSALKQKMYWEDILPDNLLEFMTSYERAYNCDKSLLFSVVVPLIGTLCGTKAAIKSTNFQQSLNFFCIGVCAPGGGKSTVFKSIINRVEMKIKDQYGIDLCLENYTSAGLQTHQSENEGYGLICTDEGSRWMCSLNDKESRNQGEKALLCKLWDGSGDISTLSATTRGFQRTSLSIALLVQPCRFIQEILGLEQDDGFIDRLSVIVAKPRFYEPLVNTQAADSLKKFGVEDMVHILVDIFNYHKDQDRVYIFDEEAQELFNEKVIQFGEEMNKRYASDEEEPEAVASQSVSQVVEERVIRPNSKSLTLELKLSAILHVWFSAMSCRIKSNQSPLDIPVEITAETLKRARIFNVRADKHKEVFLKSVRSIMPKVDLKLRVPKNDRTALKIREAILKSEGPIAMPRDLLTKARCSKSRLEDEISILQKEGFAPIDCGIKKVDASGRGRSKKKEVLFKPHPDVLDEELKFVNDLAIFLGIAASAVLQTYRAHFNKTQNLSEIDRQTCRLIHPHKHLMSTILTQEDSDDAPSLSQLLN